MIERLVIKEQDGNGVLDVIKDDEDTFEFGIGEEGSEFSELYFFSKEDAIKLANYILVNQ